MSQDKQNCLPKAAGRQTVSTAASSQGRGFGPLRGYPEMQTARGVVYLPSHCLLPTSQLEVPVQKNPPGLLFLGW